MPYGFGAGDLFAIQTQDASGTAPTNPTPVKLGTLQEISLDFGFDLKKLYGKQQFPLAVGRGKGSLTAKAKLAEIDGRVLSDLVFGQTAASGIKGVVSGFAASVPSGTPWQITVSPPNSGTFATDLGVIDATTGNAMTKVASGPTAGQYSVTTGGVYTFASADANKAVLLSYEYTASSATARYGTLTNQNMGASPFFACYLYESYAGSDIVLKFNRCTTSKFSFPFKNEDFAMPDFEFEMMADAGGNIGYWATR